MRWHRDELILILDLYLSRRSFHSLPEGTFVDSLAAQLKEISPLLGRKARFEQVKKTNIQDVLGDFWRIDPGSTASDKSRRKLLTLPEREGSLLQEIWIEFGKTPELCHQVAGAILLNAIDQLSSQGEKQESSTLSDEEVVESEAEPEQVDYIVEAEEGKILTLVHTRRERNRQIVSAKKNMFFKTYGRLFCEACGFDFVNFYGQRGKGFIECHHTNPVHTLAPGATTHVDDLMLLCANCHRMIHSKRPWLSVDQLRELIKKRN